MAHDVFVSYAAENKPIADAACATLESAGLRCWIAPRDILPGDDWSQAIIRAIRQAKAFVLVFSSDANASRQVPREVERAIEYGVPIIPFRIEDVSPEGALELQLATVHWLDALSPPLEAHFNSLVTTLKALLERTPSDKTATGALRTIMGQPRGRAADVETNERSPRWWRPALAAAGLIVISTATYLLTRPDSEPTAPASEQRDLKSSTETPPPVAPSTSDATGPPPLPRIAAPAPSANVARPAPGSSTGTLGIDRLKQIARSNSRLTCDGFFCSLSGLRSYYPAVRKIIYGESAGRLNRVVVLPHSPDSAPDENVWFDGRYLPYTPGSPEVYSRLEFIDGTTSDVTPAMFSRDPTPIAGARIPAEDPAAPALFTGFRHGEGTLRFVPEVTPATTAVMYAVDSAPFVRAEPAGGSRGGFQFETPVRDAFVRLRFVDADGSERGPFRYVAGDMSTLVVSTALRAVEYLRQPTAPPPIDCKRLSFPWPLPDPDRLPLSERGRARSAVTQAERHLRTLPFVTNAPVVACVAKAMERPAGWSGWIAVKSVTHWVVRGPDETASRVSVDWKNALDRRFGQNVDTPSATWKAILPATAQTLFVDMTLQDGSHSAELRVPIEDVRLP